jgi:transposase
MYRDVAQWSSIRRQILLEGVSIRQVVRETGISRKTVRKMLGHPAPKPYGPRNRQYPKLGPHMASIQGMLRENATLPRLGSPLRPSAIASATRKASPAVMTP